MKCIIRSLSFILLGLCGMAHAEPYLAVQQGLACVQCHVNPTGGGQRTVYGAVFAQTQLPHPPVETGNTRWTGEVTQLLSLGGNARFSGVVRDTPDTPSSNQFSLEQLRLYMSVNIIPQRLLVYVDELLAPGSALNREAYALLWSDNHRWYLKAGQLYLPFGLRLEDQTAFVRQATGINMTTPDRGAEMGLLSGPWEWQLAISNGTAGAPEVDPGKQFSTQLVYVRPAWRAGVGGNINDAAVGKRTALGVFAGLKTGPIAWLSELDLVQDNSVTPSAQHSGSALLEANYNITKGHNLKLTTEYFDPDRDVSHDLQTRYSVVYEFTPIQFLQFRMAARFNDGIPQNDAQHQRLYFMQLHAFF